jgi:Fasciclin domain
MYILVSRQVFAPNNDAFEALHPMTMTLLQSNNGRGVLTETLQRHLMSVVLPTTNDIVPVGSSTKLENGGLLLNKDASGVLSINGATFTTRDTLALNGLVHTIESVLLPTSAAAAVSTPAPALDIPSLAPVPMPTEVVACANFECPQYMEAKPNQECQESIADCRCITGYEMQQDGSCVMPTNNVTDAAPAVERLCNFQCPRNSRRRENRQCWSNIDDCTCINGYQKNGNTCVQTNVDQFVRRCMYSCPPNSSQRPDRTCIDSFADCQCNPGHISISIGCI